MTDVINRDQFAEKFYGLKEEGDDDEEEDIDIEAAIKKEAAGITAGGDKPRLFSAVKIDIDCVLFFKVQPPIDPVDFCHRICKDVAKNPQKRLTKYINRLSPMTLIGSATEKGLEKLLQTVLRSHFQLAAQDDIDTADPEQNRNNEAKDETHSVSERRARN